MIKINLKTNWKVKIEEKAQVVELNEEEISLLIVVIEEPNEFLLQEVFKSDFLDGHWYLDIGVNSHMTWRRNFIFDLDKSYGGTIEFGDGSRIMMQDKWNILLKISRWKNSGTYKSSLHNFKQTPLVLGN